MNTAATQEKISSWGFAHVPVFQQWTRLEPRQCVLIVLKENKKTTPTYSSKVKENRLLCQDGSRASIALRVLDPNPRYAS